MLRQSIDNNRHIYTLISIRLFKHAFLVVKLLAPNADISCILLKQFRIAFTTVFESDQRPIKQHTLGIFKTVFLIIILIMYIFRIGEGHNRDSRLQIQMSNILYS